MPAGPFHSRSARRSSQPRFAVFHPPENHRQRALLQLRARHHSGCSGVHLAGNLGRTQPLRRDAVPGSFHKNELGGNSGFIVSLCEDNRGNIWIGTDSGVVLYDAETDRFRALDTPSDRGTVIHNKVTTIKKDRQGVIWMAVNNQGLFSCDPESGALKNYFVEEGRQTLPANHHLVLLRREQRVLALALFLEPLPRPTRR